MLVTGEIRENGPLTQTGMTKMALQLCKIFWAFKVNYITHTLNEQQFVLMQKTKAFLVSFCLFVV